MEGLEQNPVYKTYKFNAKTGKISEKNTDYNGERVGSAVKRYPAYRYDQLTNTLDEIKKGEGERESEPEKRARQTKLRLVGVFLAMIAAGVGAKVGTDTKKAINEQKTEQSGNVQTPKPPIKFIESDNSKPVVMVIEEKTMAEKKEPISEDRTKNLIRTKVEPKSTRDLEKTKFQEPKAVTIPSQTEKIKVEPKKSIIEKIFHREARSFDQMFDYHHKGKFKNADKMEEELKQYWIDWYKNHPDRLQGLLNGHYEYTAWEPHITQRLKQKNIGDAELWNSIKYFALTESDFINKKPSKANAVGPFQLMKATGTADPCNLTINKIVDPRRDPLEGAEAAARLIQDDRERLGEKNRPIKMAKYVYNAPYGSFALTQAKAENAEFNTNYFMHFIEDDMNIIKDIAHGGRWDIYRTKKNERLDDIFARFKKAGKITNDAEFYCLNRLVSRNKKLKAGVKIILPLVVGIERSEKAKEAFYNKTTAGRRENASYRPRMEAIKDRIKASGALNRIKEPIKFREIMTTAEKAVPVSKIIKRYGLTHEQFKKINEKIVGNIIPPDTKIRLPQG